MPRLTIDDINLMPSFNRGEPAAFETVYYEFIRPLRYFVEQIIHDTQAAEDITAEAFSRTFQKNTDFANLQKVKSFLYTTASNRAMDYLRQQKRHKNVHEELRYISEGEMDDIELEYVQAEAVRAIYQAIESLPPQPRQVIKMAFMEGKKLPEIAAELNLSYNTVQNYRGRGLELLRRHLLKNKLLSSTGVAFGITFLSQPDNFLLH